MIAALITGVAAAGAGYLRTHGKLSFTDALSDGTIGAVLVFGIFAIVHLLRAPWLERNGNGDPRTLRQGVGGVLVFVLLIAGMCTVFWSVASDLRTQIVLSAPADTGMRGATKTEEATECRALEFKEPEESLRRRTINLASDIDHYVETRWVNHPSRICEGQNVPNPTDEQMKEIRECQKYDDETVRYINDNFKDKWIRIVKEYGAKGVKTATLENDMEQNHPAQNTFLPFWPAPNDGNYGSAQSKFRELAYHVDSRGNVVDFR